MKSIFERVERRSSEDLTTEVLGYICTDPHFKKEKLTFLDMILDAEEDMYVATQHRGGSSVRFDLLLRNPTTGTTVVVENKFNAPFTYSGGKHQLLRYKEWLADNTEGGISFLVVLTVRYRELDIREEIHEHLSDSSGPDSSRSNAKIKVVILFWEDLLERWSSDAAKRGDQISGYLVQELRRYIDSYYLMTVNLTEADVNILQDPSGADALIHVFKTVETVRSNMLGITKTIDSKVSFEEYFWSYGFNFQIHGFSFWFGFWPKAWKDLGHPFVLQVHLNRRAKGLLVGEVASKFKKVQYDGTEDPGDISYCRPLELPMTQPFDTTTVSNALRAILNEMGSLK